MTLKQWLKSKTNLIDLGMAGEICLYNLVSEKEDQYDELGEYGWHCDVLSDGTAITYCWD